MKRRHVLLFLVALAACAGGRDEVLSRTLAGVNAARDAFTTYDAAHQAEIVEAAKSLDEGKAALVAYRSKRTKVSVAFVAAYAAVAAASTDANSGSLAKAADAARALVQALRDLGVM